MANYLYKTTIYKNPDAISGVSETNNQAHKDAKADFETNNKANATAVNNVLLEETTFVVTVDYPTFVGYIDGTVIVWADVKFIDSKIIYELNLLSNTPL